MGRRFHDSWDARRGGEDDARRQCRPDRDYYDPHFAPYGSAKDEYTRAYDEQGQREERRREDRRREEEQRERHHREMRRQQHEEEMREEYDREMEARAYEEEQEQAGPESDSIDQ